jgi:hypothetical protein
MPFTSYVLAPSFPLCVVSFVLSLIHDLSLSLSLFLLLQAEKQGWNYHVDKEHKERIPPKSYGTLRPSYLAPRDVRLKLTTCFHSSSGKFCAYPRKVEASSDQVERSSVSKCAGGACSTPTKSTWSWNALMQ